jgi:hypothetical protein
MKDDEKGDTVSFFGDNFLASTTASFARAKSLLSGCLPIYTKMRIQVPTVYLSFCLNQNMYSFNEAKKPTIAGRNIMLQICIFTMNDIIVNYDQDLQSKRALCQHIQLPFR